jgi:hypothetical protein
MIWLFRILAFLFAFALGVLAAQMSAGITAVSQIPPSPSSTSSGGARGVSIGKAVTPDGRVQISYAGWSTLGDSESLVVKFRVHNGTPAPVTYDAYIESNPFPRVKVNGKPVEHFYCGTGIKTFQIVPGESVNFTASANDFIDWDAKKRKANDFDRVKVGFYLNTADQPEGELFETESFELADEILIEIERERKRIEAVTGRK